MSGKEEHKDNKIGAPVGNQNAKKLTTPELKEAAYKQYCDHIASGKPKTTWYFEHPELSLTWETMEVYMKNEIEFPPIKRKIAETKGYAKWMDICANSATGADHGKSSTASLNMYMRNVYGWDKDTRQQMLQQQEQEKQQYEKTMERMFSQLSKMQSITSENSIKQS